MDWKRGIYANYYREIRNLPPSAKFVMYILNHLGSATRKDLIRQTLLSSRTIGNALKTLKDLDLIKKEKLVNNREIVSDKRVIIYKINLNIS
ncbi:MAG: hypothetical protein GF329_19845 [Candidatus Lokiarchaeota archaeon]|nr:hypothetical protein [Candidatus Lokiarchaeota archaeon]